MFFHILRIGNTLAVYFCRTMPLLKRWLSFSPLYAVSTIYLWLLATTPFTRTQALKADRLRAKKPYRIHHKSYYTIWYFCEWAHCIRNSRVPRGTLYRKWTKRKKPLIYKGFRVVVTVGLEPTTPSMWTMCTGLPVKLSNWNVDVNTPEKPLK